MNLGIVRSRCAQGSAPRAGRRGGALAAALLIVMLVALLSSAMLQISSSLSRQQVASSDQKRAFYAAEAGLAEGSFSVMMGKSGTIANQEAPAEFGDALFWVESEDLGEDVTKLDCTALAGTGRAKLSLVVLEEHFYLGSLGLFGDQGVTIGGGSEIDGYSSALGTYTPGPGASPPKPTEIHSNGDIEVDGSYGKTSTHVLGDLVPGPEGSALIDPAATVTGSSDPATELEELPAVVVPALAGGSDYTVNLFATLSDVEVDYGDVLVGKTGTLMLDGPLTVTMDTFSVASGGKVLVNSAAGPIDLYVRERLSLAEGSMWIDSSRDPQKVAVFVTAADDPSGGDDKLAPVGPPPVTILATGDFYGTLYAPEATLSLPASFNVFGSAVGASLILAPLSTFHFDQALEGAGPSVYSYQQVAWRMLAVPPELSAGTSDDPFAVLGLDPALPLEKPYAAHVDELYGIVYVGLDGVTKTFIGLEADFSVADVAMTIGEAHEGNVLLKTIVAAGKTIAHSAPTK